MLRTNIFFRSTFKVERIYKAPLSNKNVISKHFKQIPLFLHAKSFPLVVVAAVGAAPALCEC